MYGRTYDTYVDQIPYISKCFYVNFLNVLESPGSKVNFLGKLLYGRFPNPGLRFHACWTWPKFVVDRTRGRFESNCTSMRM